MRHDSLSDALVTIKNADHVGKDSAAVPASKLIGDVLKQFYWNFRASARITCTPSSPRMCSTSGSFFDVEANFARIIWFRNSVSI